MGGLGPPSTDRAGAGRSRRSTPSRGEPGTWGRAAAVSRREEAVMPKDAPPNGGAPARTGRWGRVGRVSEMQAKLHRWAAADPGRRFDDLFNFVHDPATLIDGVRAGRGKPGREHAGRRRSDRRDGGASASGSRGSWTTCGPRSRRARSGRCRCGNAGSRNPAGRGSSASWASRPIADRVVQAALKLVLEPIFEADFLPVSYGFRPKRRAHDAIAEIHMFGSQRLSLGAGRGHRGVLRLDRPHGPDGPGARSGQGQARAGAGEGVPQGRGA